MTTILILIFIKDSKFVGKRLF